MDKELILFYFVLVVTLVFIAAAWNTQPLEYPLTSNVSVITEVNLMEVRDRCDRMGGVMDIISRGKNLEIVCKEKENQFFNYQLFDSAKP